MILRRRMRVMAMSEPAIQEQPRECEASEAGWLRENRVYIYAGVLALGVIVAYWRTMQWVTSLSIMHVDTGGGLFAPLVSAYLVWSQRDELKGLDRARSRWGTLALVFGLLLFVGGIWGRFASLLTLSLVLVVWGLVSTMGGYQLGKKLAFPIAYLAFVCPAPTVLDNLSLPLRQFAAVVASILPDALGMETRIEGTELIVDGFRTMVDAPCSGLSYLLALFAASTLVAYLSNCSMTRKVIFALSALPIALAANIVRIQATFLLHQVFGDIFSEGVGHFMVGIIVLIFALLSLLGVWSLTCQDWNDDSSPAPPS